MPGLLLAQQKFTQIQQLQISKRHVKGSMKSLSPYGHPSTPILVGCSRNQHWWYSFKLLIMVISLLVAHVIYLESSHSSYNPHMLTLHVCLEPSAILSFFFQEIKKSIYCLNLDPCKRLTWGLQNFHHNKNDWVITFNTNIKTEYKN